MSCCLCIISNALYSTKYVQYDISYIYTGDKIDLQEHLPKQSLVMKRENKNKIRLFQSKHIKKGLND